MSFSVDVKNELVRNEEKSVCCLRMELAALIWMGGVVFFGGQGRLGLKFVTENASVARKVLRSLKNEQIVDTEVKVSRSLRLKKNNSYEIKALPSGQVNEFLTRLGIIRDGVLQEQPEGPPKKKCCRKAWLRGAFMGGGSVNRPEVEYHLELVTQNEGFAVSLLQTLRSFGWNAGMTGRKQDFVVYLKEGDAVTGFLAQAGAHNALMAFENVRIVKGMRNQVNRLVNCETANLAKTVNASVRQLESIRRIEQVLGFTALSPTLREAAELRLDNPEATLKELVEAIGGRISRSGMSHRLKALESLGEKLKEQGPE